MVKGAAAAFKRMGKSALTATLGIAGDAARGAKSSAKAVARTVGTAAWALKTGVMAPIKGAGKLAKLAVGSTKKLAYMGVGALGDEVRLGPRRA